MADTISEAITETALGPASVSVDGTTAQAQPIEELIKADRHQAAQSLASGATKRTGLRMFTVKGNGA